MQVGLDLGNCQGESKGGCLYILIKSHSEASNYPIGWNVGFREEAVWPKGALDGFGRKQRWFWAKRGAIRDDCRDDFGNHLQWEKRGSRFKKLDCVSDTYNIFVVFSYDVLFIPLLF